MKYRIVGIDVDGTLLTWDDRVTEENLAAIKEACDNGVHCAIVTGRPLGAIPKRIVSIPGLHYCLTSNGGIVTRVSDDATPQAETLRRSLLTVEETLRIMDILEEHGAVCEVIVDHYGYTDPKTFEIYLNRMEGKKARVDYLLGTRRVVDDIRMFLRTGKAPRNYDPEYCDWDQWLPEREEVPVTAVENVVIFGMPKETGAALAAIYAELGFHVVNYADVILEIGNPKSDKGSGLRSLAAELGIPEEETMGIGDSSNDLELLAAAGLGVAMGNAEPHLLPYADVMTLDNEHSGVAHAIWKWALEKE